MVDSRGERGTLHWDPGFALQEVVDPATGAWVEGDGRGELVGTPLESEAEALFRIGTGDEVRFRPGGSCPCGSRWPGIESGTVRRLDEMFKIKGVNVWPSHVETTLFRFEAVRDYKARIFQDDGGREVVELSVLTRSSSGAPERLAGRIGEDLRDATGLSVGVRIVDDPVEWTQQTTGEAGKTRRWSDERMRR
jgi:phenylacetate-CoA ligase